MDHVANVFRPRMKNLNGMIMTNSLQHCCMWMIWKSPTKMKHEWTNSLSRHSKSMKTLTHQQRGASTATSLRDPNLWKHPVKTQFPIKGLPSCLTRLRETPLQCWRTCTWIWANWSFGCLSNMNAMTMMSYNNWWRSQINLLAVFAEPFTSLRCIACADV